MIAVGTSVLFIDCNQNTWKAEPHSGQVASISGNTGDGYVLAFADGRTAWAFPNEVTAL